MSNLLLRGEIFSKLKVIKKQFKRLSIQKFPTDGASDLTNIILEILSLIEKRFQFYTDRQLKHVKITLFNSLGTICGYLANSTLKNIPWSIIPAYEELFCSIHKNTEFIISPIWELNYRIIKINVLEDIKKNLILVPGLLFEYDEDFDLKVNDFMKTFPDGIYFIFFPKLERVSALHLALLGHEIGHIFALDWVQTCFHDYLKNTKLVPEFKRIAEENNRNRNELFREMDINKEVVRNLEFVKLILMELISDIYGALIFGTTSLVASYVFKLGSSFDVTDNWRKGYLSWRFRLKTIKKALEYIDEKHNCSEVLENIIYKKNSEICELPAEDNKINDYVSFFLLGFAQEFETIMLRIEEALGDKLYPNFLDLKHIKCVRERLANSIPPNSHIDSGLNEFPIDFRNILFGTWLYIYENLPENLEEFYQFSRRLNLLSIKGIELSHEQVKYNDFIKR